MSELSDKEKKELWIKMKHHKLDSFYLEAKAGGLNPGIPVINPKEGIKVFPALQNPCTDKTCWCRK